MKILYEIFTQILSFIKIESMIFHTKSSCEFLRHFINISITTTSLSSIAKKILRMCISQYHQWRGIHTINFIHVFPQKNLSSSNNDIISYERNELPMIVGMLISTLKRFVVKIVPWKNSIENVWFIGNMSSYSLCLGTGHYVFAFKTYFIIDVFCNICIQLNISLVMLAFKTQTPL